MPDYAVMLLLNARQKAGHVNKVDECDVESITEAHKSRDLIRSIDINAPCQDFRLVAHNANGNVIKPGKARHYVGCKLLLHLKKASPVKHLCNHVPHVIRLLRVKGNDSIKPLCLPCR